MLAWRRCVQVAENAEPGLFLAYVAARDADGGKNGQVDCRVEGGGPFRLDSFYGSEFKLIAMASFDREARAEYRSVGVAIRAVTRQGQSGRRTGASEGPRATEGGFMKKLPFKSLANFVNLQTIRKRCQPNLAN